MSRLSFDSNGKLVGVDGSFMSSGSNGNSDDENGDYKYFSPRKLKRSDSLGFLKDESKKVDNIFEHGHWSLYLNDKALNPLKFSNGKTQEDVVKEIVDSIKSGTKIIFLHGTCGTGKSAIALNIARTLGKASVVVPVKALQRQYEDDYMEKMYLLKKNGNKMKIAMLTGRENHDSIINPGTSCADPTLPENIRFTEKNYKKIREYYDDNPFASNKDMPEIKDLRRMLIAPANPYWSPILPAEFEVNILRDAKKKKYTGCDGREYVLYHRKPGCSYYDQHLAYLVADVIIFNSAKYLSELALGRK